MTQRTKPYPVTTISLSLSVHCIVSLNTLLFILYCVSFFLYQALYHRSRYTSFLPFLYFSFLYCLPSPLFLSIFLLRLSPTDSVCLNLPLSACHAPALSLRPPLSPPSHPAPRCRPIWESCRLGSRLQSPTTVPSISRHLSVPLSPSLAVPTGLIQWSAVSPPPMYL